MSIQEDLIFALESGEFKSRAPLLRYVASINPEATRAEFVAAREAAGYRANSATNRFNESRAFDLKNYGGSMDKAGRLTN